MARLFDDASTEYLQVESAVATSYPFGMVSWFNTDSDSQAQVIVWVGDKDAGNDYCALQANGNIAGDPVVAFSYGTTIERAVTSTTYSTNVWQHAAAIWLSASERHVYLNGGGKGSNTNAINAIVGYDRTALGGARDNTPGAYMSGHIAEAAVWDLTSWGANDAERETAFELAIASMAKGYAPSFFPLGLLGYWPLVRGLNDYVGGFNMTANGTAVSSHPRIIYPSKIWVPHKEVAVAPSGQMITIIMSKLLIPSIYLKQGKTKRRDFLKNTFLASMGIK